MKTAKTGSTVNTLGDDALCAKCLKMNMTAATSQNELPSPTCHRPKPKRTNKRRKLPIIERLRIVRVSSASISDRSRRRKCRPKRNSETAGPLPNEVYVEQSLLGFDGISPRKTMLKKIPTRFTFDDVVPSSSSIATVDLTENQHAEEQLGSAHILGDLMKETTQLGKNAPPMTWNCKPYQIPTVPMYSLLANEALLPVQSIRKWKATILKTKLL